MNFIRKVKISDNLKAKMNYIEKINKGKMGVISGTCSIFDSSGNFKEKYFIPHNEVTEKFYILLATLCRDPSSVTGGFTYMAVGSGDPLWNVLNPPAATGLETSLYAETFRKPIASITFVDDQGTPTVNRTRWIDVLATFGPGEGTGSIMEIGIFGGNSLDVPSANDELLSVIHKPLKVKGAGETFSYELRFQFGP